MLGLAGEASSERGIPMNKLITIAAGVILSLSLSLSSALADSPKIGFIYIGPPGDHGWTYMHDQGRKAIVDELGLKQHILKVYQKMQTLSVLLEN